jgi:hypothetical protein
MRKFADFGWLRQPMIGRLVVMHHHLLKTTSSIGADGTWSKGEADFIDLFVIAGELPLSRRLGYSPNV